MRARRGRTPERYTPPTRKNPTRRASKPVTRAPGAARHHVLVACDNESKQREVYEHLRTLGVACRLLVI
jgi:hypothetical protein